MKKQNNNNNQADDNSIEELDADTSDNVEEIGGPKGLEPTRYGDWENNGRCWDF